MSKVGKCHICGEEKNLTFEHVPPKSAFNKSSELLSYRFNVSTGAWEPEKDNPYGVGKYTLCQKCNNDTGGTYGQAFCDFISKVAEVTRDGVAYGEVIEFDYNGFLHRIFKQILTMYCSTCGDGFVSKHPRLKDYILNPKSEECPEGLNIYIYLVNRVTKLNTGISGILNTSSKKTVICSEILFWPLGYILSFDEKIDPSNVNGATVLDVTHWSEYPLRKRQTEKISLCKNQRLLMFPLDFRSKSQIERDCGPINPPGIAPFLDYEL